MLTSLLLPLALTVVFHAYSVSAQGTNATCAASFSWATNSRGQSPCLQAAYLNGGCLTDPQDAFVFSLPEDFHYRPPTAALATPCQCSTVFYSVLAACALCQNRTVLPWSAWETNCSIVYTSAWPVNVPPGTSIPSWAFIDVVTPDTFNATVARALAAANPAESSPAVVPSTSFTFSATNSASAASSTPSSGSGHGSGNGSGSGSDNSNTEQKRKSNVGPIVGGVVGGVGGAAILAGTIAFFYIRHQRQSTTTTTAQGGTTPLAGSNSGFVPSTANDQYQQPPLTPQMYQPQGTGYPTLLPPQPTQSPGPGPSSATGLLYNPDDPSTFPTTAGGPPSGSGYAPSQYTTGAASSNQVVPVSPFGYQPQQQLQQQGGGRYTGVAEV